MEKAMNQWGMCLVSALGGLAVLGCSGDDNWQAEELTNADAPALSWQDFQSHAETKVRFIDGEKVYIVEWDIPIRERDLHEYYINRFVEKEKSTVDSLTAGGDNVWSTAAKTTLSYCISIDFGTNHARMQGEVARATWHWAREANVRFIYRPWHDANCVDSNTDVEVPVQPYFFGGACAFSPNQDAQPNCTSAGRALVIDVGDVDTWPIREIFGEFYSNMTTEGVLRHEFGHILGLRHEHIREADNAIADCDLEVNNPGPYRALTDYDSNSVMHYPWCDGTVPTYWNITRLDAQGVRSLYGSPAWIDTVL